MMFRLERANDVFLNVTGQMKGVGAAGHFNHWLSVVQMKDQSDFINVLLNEKLVEKINDQFELTELGRRFIRNFEQVERE